MLLYSTTRCFIFYLLIINFFVIGWDELFDDMFDPKDQTSQKVDNIFDHSSIKEKENIHKRKSNDTAEEKCPSTDVKRYRLTIDFSPSEFVRLKQFASSSDYNQDNVLHDVHDISDYLKLNAYVNAEDNSSYNGLTWSAWIRSFDINAIFRGILSLPVLALIGIFIIRNHIRRVHWFTSLFIICFIISLLQNWGTLYQIEQAKINDRLLKGLSKECQGQSKGLFDSFTSFVSSFFQSPVDKCFQYHEAVQARPHLKATLMQALSMTTTDFFITLLGPLGEGLSKFFRGLMQHIPRLAAPFVIIIVLVFILFVIFVLVRYGSPLPLLGNDVARLKNENEKLRLQLAQRTNFQVEHNSSSLLRKNRSLSNINRKNQNQKRFLLNQRLNISSDDADDEI